MKKISQKLLGLFFIFSLFLLLTSTTNAQNYNKSDSTHKMHRSNYMKSDSNMSKAHKYSMDVRKSAISLKKELKLSSKQTMGVEKILQEYKTNPGNLSQGGIVDKIDSLLTKTQKTKFNKIKDTWWNKTQKALSSTPSMPMNKPPYQK